MDHNVNALQPYVGGLNDVSLITLMETPEQSGLVSSYTYKSVLFPLWKKIKVRERESGCLTLHPIYFHARLQPSTADGGGGGG